tara:strand:+ start:544 stop:1545 length:1002 start_codon:yes stop_codon:yes gene_type:complete
MYDVYYTTGGGPYTNAGSDKWVNDWLELIAPKLDVKPILLIHRNKPKNFDDYDYEFPIETYWHGDDINKFEELCRGARRINILHGHYTPLKPILENKDKIHSNILHNSVDHVLKSSLGLDTYTVHAPYMDSAWEKEVANSSKHNIWVGLFDILIENENIQNFYQFKQNLELSDSNTIGFCARPEGRKNPHFLDGMKSFMFTESLEMKWYWKSWMKFDFSKSKIYHYNSEFKDEFYNKDWGISHSCFTNEPFGYGIFEAVDYGKLPILYTSWCKDFEYPYRAKNKKEFVDIYNQLCKEPYSVKKQWFDKLKSYMVENYTDKNKWINSLLDIYNI